MPVELSGILTALITPLEPDGQTVDIAGLQTLVASVLQAGSRGVVVLGGTGEYTALSSAQRERAVVATVEAVAGRVPVVAGILAPGLADAIDAAGMAERCGVDLLMPVTPYYVHPGQPGLREWFLRFAERTTAPLILYNIPFRTKVNLEPETIVDLWETTRRIAGVKECSSDLGQFGDLIACARERFSVLSGEEFYALPHLLLGAQGAILASANLIPSEWVALFGAARRGDFVEARAIYDRMFPLLRALFAETNPGPLKEAMRRAGLPAGPAAFPLMPPSQSVTDRLAAALAGPLVGTA